MEKIRIRDGKKFISDLHGDREVVLCLGREEDVHRLLGEGGVAGGRAAHLDNVQLAASRPPHSETEQSRVLLTVTLD